MGDINTSEISAGLTNLLASIDRLINAPDLTNTFRSANAAVEQYRVVGEKVAVQVDSLAHSVTNTLAEADQALAELRGAAGNLRTMLASGAPLRHDLGVVLDQLATAAQSISSLAEFLRTHPNALIGGRRRLEPEP